MPAAGEDALTGLHDRKAFLLALRRRVGESNEKQESLALMVVDVDSFAAINGIHGYEFGDRALSHLSEQLKLMARSHDYLARIGDNRFAVILSRVMNPGHAELAVQKLLRLLETPYQHGDARVKMTVTVGVAMLPLHASHAEYLLRLAERALHSARIAGRRYEFPPDSGKDDTLSELWDLEMDLQGAVQRDGTEPVYLDIELAAGASVEQHLPPGHNAFLYVFRGEVTVEGKGVPSARMAILTNPGPDGTAWAANRRAVTVVR